MKPTRHCYRCGWVWELSGQPGRNDTCHQCGADLRCCRNCLQYDPTVAEQCRERRAELVHDKTASNFCEYFEMSRRAFADGGGDGTGEGSREDKARDDLKKLFGD